MDKLNSQFVDEYAKRIFGFAYNKTGNTHDAEDLSQEIMMSLFTAIPKYTRIDNMDGFVYTICCYCWANFYRSNGRHWKNVNIDDISLKNLSDGSDVESEVQNAIFIKKMQKEIAYLSKLHRDIVIMRYYDGKSSRQISDELNISDSTVRWHLVEIRKKLKGRIENMGNENLGYKPIQLRAVCTGRSSNGTRGIGQYRLVDNICYACYGKPLTIEEISQKLSVAAAFIEPHLDELVFMDYIKLVDNNKYQTTFFIKTGAFWDIANKYNYDNAGDKAEKVYEAIEKRYSDIKNIGFAGSDSDKDFMLWVIIPLLITRLELKARNIIGQKKEYYSCMPKRKDGCEHWVSAYLVEDDYKSSLSDEILEFTEKASGGYCDPWIPEEIASFQFSSHATYAHHRNALRGRELQDLSQIADIIKNNINHEHNKLLISRYAELGYVRVEDRKVQMLIPYLRKNEYDEFNKILLETEASLGDDFFVDYIEGYMNIAKKQIPDFLSDNEKNHIATGISSINTIPYYLTERNILRYPTDEEARRLGIIIWDMK